MEHRFNTVNSVDSSLKESSHARQLRIRRRQSVHDVLNDKSLLDSVLNQDNRQQVRRDTSTVYGQKLEREAKDPVVAAAMASSAARARGLSAPAAAAPRKRRRERAALRCTR